MTAVMQYPSETAYPMTPGMFAKRRLYRPCVSKPKAPGGPSARFDSTSYAAALAEAQAAGKIKQIPAGQTLVGAGKWPWPPAFVSE